jgi:NADH-quinone oxidoreductase subunit E
VDYYEDLTPETLTRILNELAAGKTPKPGPQIDRQNSAPIGGANTLTDPSIYDAKKRGETANVHEAAVPKPPIADATDPRRG